MPVREENRVARVVLGVAWACALFAHGVEAAEARAGQSVTAAVHGLVRDASDATVPGASVVILSLDTALARRGTSSQDGAFRFVALSPGRYRLSVMASGFESFEQVVDLTSDMQVDLRIRLQVRKATQDVVVSAAELPLVEPSKTSLGRTITKQEIDQLPIPTGLARDVTVLATRTPGVIADNTGVSPIATAGQSGNDNTFLLDGLSVDSAISGGQTGNLPPDAIQELRVVSNHFSVEFGQASGAVVNVVTRSGTNVSRGRGYLLYQDGGWAATSAPARLAGAKDPDLNQATLGGYWSGPLIRGRAFLFGSVEQVARSTVYAVSSPVATAFRPGEPLVWPLTTTAPKAFVRADVHAGDTNVLTMRYLHLATTSPDSNREAQSARERGRTFAVRIDSAALLDRQVFGASVVNEWRAQWTRSVNDVGVAGFCPDCAALNYPDIKLGKPSNAPQHVTGDRTEIADVVTWLVGPRARHTIRGGIDVNLIRQFGNNPLNTSGTYVFPRGAGPFDPLDRTSYPNRFTQNLGNASFDVRATIASTFAEETWQVRSGLSTHVGFRWDYTEWSGLPRVRNDFAPRAGVAFDPWQTGVTAFRAAIGRYYGELLMPIARDGAIGFVQQTIRWPGYQKDPVHFDVTGPNPNRTGPAVFQFSVNRLTETATPYTDQLSVGMQRQIGRYLGASADVVRALGYRLLIQGDLNRVDPETHRRPDSSVEQIIVSETRARSWYTGLQVGLRKAHSHGFAFSTAYLWSSAQNDTDGRSALPVDATNLSVDRGPSPNDARHRINIDGTVDLPFACRLAVVVTARSSLPYNITTGIDKNEDGQLNDRPEGVGRNAARGSPMFRADARISRSWRIGRTRFELLAETFNVTNRDNWSGYSGVQTAVSFGQPTTAGSPRQAQFGVRFEF